MPLMVPSTGAVYIFGIFLGQLPPSALVYHLYQNNHIPAEGDQVADYVELVATGYHPLTIQPFDWTVAPAQGGGMVASAPEDTLSLAGSTQAYGYYVTDLSGLQLCWAELFPDGPIPITSDTKLLSIVPTISAM